MKAELLDWPVEDHGLIWRLTEVLPKTTFDTLTERIKTCKLPSTKPAPDELTKSSIWNANPNFEWVEWEGVLQWQLDFYPEMVDAYKRAGIEIEIGTPDLIDCGIYYTQPNTFYKAHKDVSTKLTSMVIYLYPDEAEPTTFIAPDGTVRTVPWEPNTGYVFARNELSLHQYMNTTQDRSRYTYMLNLIDCVKSSYEGIDEYFGNSKMGSWWLDGTRRTDENTKDYLIEKRGW